MIEKSFNYIFILKGYESSLSNDLPEEVKEKLAIARVLMNNPDVLILDSCMTNINVFTQMAIITDFVSANKFSFLTTPLTPCSTLRISPFHISTALSASKNRNCRHQQTGNRKNERFYCLLSRWRRDFWNFYQA